MALHILLRGALAVTFLLATPPLSLAVKNIPLTASDRHDITVLIASRSTQPAQILRIETVAVVHDDDEDLNVTKKARAILTPETTGDGFFHQVVADCRLFQGQWRCDEAYRRLQVNEDPPPPPIKVDLAIPVVDALRKYQSWRAETVDPTNVLLEIRAFPNGSFMLKSYIPSYIPPEVTPQSHETDGDGDTRQ